MEMLHLRYFVAVAEELNFSQAARKLHMAASPLSQRVKDLEHELGQKLFERSTHKVALTPAGQALLPLAKDILEQVNAIPWRLREAAEPARSTVFIGMPAGVHPALRDKVKLLEDRCRERFDLKRWPGTTADLVDGVHEGRLALTLARLPANDPALSQIEVMSERLGAAVPADRFEGQTTVRLADLVDLPYMAAPAEATPTYFEQLDTALSAAGVKQRLKLPSTGYSGMAELISSGMGFSISMLDPSSPMHGYKLDNVTILPIEDFTPELRTGLLWRADRTDLSELIEHAKIVFQEPIMV
ncbi:LysR family transcriptional regulator [Amycolatopsis sp. NPDC059657]|uniref:LysR family transcriptional regulator n=1 Tax=Amycolatopsis sp. NPDC059657 TaxID=3346899 RepID=UPI00366DC6D6